MCAIEREARLKPDRLVSLILGAILVSEPVWRSNLSFAYVAPKRWGGAS